MDRDNQQERLHFYIGYLLGIMDGEGSFQLGKDGKGHYVPEITIANTNEEIVRLVVECFRQIGFPVYIWKANGRENHKPVYRMMVKGIRRVNRVLEYLLKYEFAKKDRAKILKEFCEYRLSIPIGKKYLNLSYLNDDKKYGIREDEWKKKLTLLNLPGIRPNTKMSALSSETIRSASKKSEDIVRSYTRV